MRAVQETVEWGRGTRNLPSTHTNLFPFTGLGHNPSLCILWAQVLPKTWTKEEQGHWPVRLGQQGGITHYSLWKEPGLLTCLRELVLGWYTSVHSLEGAVVYTSCLSRSFIYVALCCSEFEEFILIHPLDNNLCQNIPVYSWSLPSNTNSLR